MVNALSFVLVSVCMLIPCMIFYDFFLSRFLWETASARHLVLAILFCILASSVGASVSDFLLPSEIRNHALAPIASFFLALTMTPQMGMRMVPSRTTRWFFAVIPISMIAAIVA